MAEIAEKNNETMSYSVNYIIRRYRELIYHVQQSKKRISELEIENEKLKEMYNKQRENYLKTKKLFEDEVVKNVQVAKNVT